MLTWLISPLLHSHFHLIWHLSQHTGIRIPAEEIIEVTFSLSIKAGIKLSVITEEILLR